MEKHTREYHVNTGEDENNQGALKWSDIIMIGVRTIGGGGRLGKLKLVVFLVKDPVLQQNITSKTSQLL